MGHSLMRIMDGILQRSLQFRTDPTYEPTYYKNNGEVMGQVHLSSAMEWKQLFVQ